MGPQAISIATSFLGPVFFLNIWTLIMEVVMLYYRIPVFVRLGIPSKPELTAEQIARLLPPYVRWKADNFNHLMQQPMNFYVVLLAIAQLHSCRGERGAGGYRTDLALAWLYVGLRLVHSYIYCVGNNIPRRFYTFLVSSVVLAVLAFRGALMVTDVMEVF